MKVKIRYEIHQATDGLIVWRIVPGKPDTALGVGRNPQTFRTPAAARDAIRVQMNSDKGAASRLGIEVDLEITTPSG